MESPLERNRELAVLIITQNVNCPMFYVLPAKQEAGSREQGARDQREGVNRFGMLKQTGEMGSGVEFKQ